ncbi:MAG: sigma-54-dependent Fis family transcriptional regulator [Chlamydiae bacterium]|nr:sigma-54-dependent Fis family transcriptional regulator [Chlamydiota bacterium]MBI3266502.1 sigma-54-dependent Fis family transcriptional regulator [Chlamydiota bacterium]
MPKVLVVDDEKSAQDSLKQLLKENYDVVTALSGEEAFKVLNEENPDLVLLDVLLPGMGGIEVLKRVRSLKPDTQVIMITGQEKVKTAVEAIKLGAFDYIHKPFEINELLGLVKRALQQRQLRDEMDHLRGQLKKSRQFDSIVGNSPKMLDLFQTITRVMNSNSNVLITGESGTGKELVARAIHYNGNRKEKPFVVVHTSAVPDKLLESELFGHEKGSFTGAIQRKDGTLEIANGGTLFLDEIGDMPLELQSKLLRAIQEKEFRRVGGTESIKVDVRFVAATNKNLEKAIKDGSFREDLYYRLTVVPVVLAPLRERREDIPLLVYHFLDRYRTGANVKVEGFSQEAMEALQVYDWPGNVREVQNAVENLVVMMDHSIIHIEDLPQQIRMHQLQKTIFDRSTGQGASLHDIVAAFEKQIIEEALRKCNGVFTRASKLLGTTRRILKYRIDQLHIQIPKGQRIKSEGSSPEPEGSAEDSARISSENSL